MKFFTHKNIHTFRKTMHLVSFFWNYSVSMTPLQCNCLINVHFITAYKPQRYCSNEHTFTTLTNTTQNSDFMMFIVFFVIQRFNLCKFVKTMQCLTTSICIVTFVSPFVFLYIYVSFPDSFRKPIQNVLIFSVQVS